MLAVATFVTHQSRGMPMNVTIDGPARDSFARGQTFYHQRHGQTNLACTHCHDRSHGMLIDLALYLAWRANGLPVEAPGVRR